MDIQGSIVKWHVPKADMDSFNDHAARHSIRSAGRHGHLYLNQTLAASAASEEDWVAATGCDGFMFLWPVIPGNRVPPIVRPFGVWLIFHTRRG